MRVCPTPRHAPCSSVNQRCAPERNNTPSKPRPNIVSNTWLVFWNAEYSQTKNSAFVYKRNKHQSCTVMHVRAHWNISHPLARWICLYLHTYKPGIMMQGSWHSECSCTHHSYQDSWHRRKFIHSKCKSAVFVDIFPTRADANWFNWTSEATFSSLK